MRWVSAGFELGIDVSRAAQAAASVRHAGSAASFSPSPSPVLSCPTRVIAPGLRLGRAFLRMSTSDRAAACWRRTDPGSLSLGGVYPAAPQPKASRPTTAVPASPSAAILSTPPPPHVCFHPSRLALRRRHLRRRLRCSATTHIPTWSPLDGFRWPLSARCSASALSSPCSAANDHLRRPRPCTWRSQSGDGFVSRINRRRS